MMTRADSPTPFRTTVVGSSGHRILDQAALQGVDLEIQKLLSKNVVLKYTPQLCFKLDTSLVEGDHVLDVLRDEANTVFSRYARHGGVQTPPGQWMGSHS